MAVDLSEHLLVGPRFGCGLAQQISEQVLGKFGRDPDLVEAGNAVTRMSAPSSSRMLVEIFVAMNSSVSAGTST